MPGGDRLARDLGIGRNTIDAALLQLEKEGLLVRLGAVLELGDPPASAGEAAKDGKGNQGPVTFSRAKFFVPAGKV